MDDINGGNLSDRYTRQRVARRIRRSLTHITPLNALPQKQSPLFGVLPPELRNIIFTLAVSEYDDHNGPPPKQPFYFRRGHMFPVRVDTNLLLTCRLVYYETNSIPMRSATHYIFLYHSPPEDGLNFFKLTKKNQDELYHVHVYAHIDVMPFWKKQSPFQRLQCRPEKITITMRLTGWPVTDRIIFQPLEYDWVESMTLPSECKKLILEFEAPSQQTTRLHRFVKTVTDWKFKRKDTVVMGTSKESMRVAFWSTHINRENVTWYLPGCPDTMDFHIVVLTWTPMPKLIASSTFEA